MANLGDLIVRGVSRLGQVFATKVEANSFIGNAKGFEFIIGTQASTTGAWTGVTKDSELYDGKQIVYYLPQAGSGNATLELTLADGTTTGAKNCYWSGTTRLTTHYAQYSQCFLVYHKALNINGTDYEGWWAADRDSNTDTKVRQTLSTTDSNYPLLMAYPDNTVSTGNVDNVVYRNNSIYANPGTGNIQAIQLNGVNIGSSPKFTDTTYTAGTGLSLSGTTFNHSNSVSAQTTQAIYPIKIDSEGHISEYGTAVTPITSHQTIKQDCITGATINRYGVCDTAAATAAKEVTLTTGTFSLETGAHIFVKFTYNNSAASPTLNVNGSGDIPLVQYGTTAMATSNSTTGWYAGAVVSFTYDGTSWVRDQGFNSDANSYDRCVVNRAVKAASAITAATVIVGTSAGYKTVASGVEFDLSFPILYASAAINSGSTATNTYQYYTGINLATTKSGFTGTQYSEAYLVLSSILGNIGIVDSTVFTTSQPTTDDGKYYIPIGIMYNTTNCFFYPRHQIFKYMDGIFSEYVSGLDKKVDLNQGVNNAGKFLVVGNNGNIVPSSVALWTDIAY